MRLQGITSGTLKGGFHKIWRLWAVNEFGTKSCLSVLGSAKIHFMAADLSKIEVYVNCENLTFTMNLLSLGWKEHSQVWANNSRRSSICSRYEHPGEVEPTLGSQLDG